MSLPFEEWRTKDGILFTEWMKTPEFRESLVKAAAEANERIAEMKKSRYITWEQWNTPMTNFSR
jgi:hypothetical protein